MSAPTINVADPDVALVELEGVVGFPQRSRAQPKARASRSACSSSCMAWLPVAGEPEATRLTRSKR